MARAHIVGAGLAGLSCALRLAQAGLAVTVYEAAGHAGGRCRSFFDEKFGRLIDNGNHLLMNGNSQALAYLDAIGSRDTLISPPKAVFPFVDLESGERWTVQPNDGWIPWWILAPSRRVAGTRTSAYLSAFRLAFAGSEDTVDDSIRPHGPLYHRFWAPLAISMLNTLPSESSAKLLWSVIAHTFARGASRCRPLVARNGLSASFVDPALRRLAELGAHVQFHRRARALDLEPDRVRALNFVQERVELGADDWLILAVTPSAAAELVPELKVPTESRAIVNAHIRLPKEIPNSGECPILGLIGGTAQWLFLRHDVASLTVSAADVLAEQPIDVLARKFWLDTSRALGLDPQIEPPIRVIKERQATFAQTSAQLVRRPASRTAWSNLLLAGDWTDTGFPATIEGAIRSGVTAAQLASKG